MTTPTPHRLVDLAADVLALRGRELSLATWNGDADHTELTVYWYQGKFYATLTRGWAGDTYYPPYWAGPPETDWREETEQGEFVKVRELAQWVEERGIKMEWLREEK